MHIAGHDALVFEHGDVAWVIVDGEQQFEARGAKLSDAAPLELHGGEPTVGLGAHDQPVPMDAVTFEPREGVVANPMHARRAQHHRDRGVEGGELVDHRRDRRVAVGGGEEALPIAGPLVEEALPMTAVGENAVDVDDDRMADRWRIIE